MEGALATFGSEHLQSQQVDAVSGLFDRLFFLRQVQEQLQARIKDLKAEVNSYRGNRRRGVDGDPEQRETLLRLLKYDIDQTWRQLNRYLGEEPLSMPGA